MGARGERGVPGGALLEVPQLLADHAQLAVEAAVLRLRGVELGQTLQGQWGKLYRARSRLYRSQILQENYSVARSVEYLEHFVL